MTSTTSTAPQGERRVFALPSLDQYERDILKTLSAALEPVETLARNIDAAAEKLPALPGGRTPTAEVERPPTVEEIGAFMIFIDALATHATSLGEFVRSLRAAFVDLDGFRREGQTWSPSLDDLRRQVAESQAQPGGDDA